MNIKKFSVLGIAMLLCGFYAIASLAKPAYVWACTDAYFTANKTIVCYRCQCPPDKRLIYNPPINWTWEPASNNQCLVGIFAKPQYKELYQYPSAQQINQWITCKPRSIQPPN